MYKKITKDAYDKLESKAKRFLVTYINGSKAYFENEMLHRTDGLAIICTDGAEYYYLDEDPHRLDGSAGGDDEYYVNGSIFSKEDFIKQLSKDLIKRFLISSENFKGQ